MQGHLGRSMNLARIKFMALLLHAPCFPFDASMRSRADITYIVFDQAMLLFLGMVKFVLFVREYRFKDGEIEGFLNL